MHRGGFFFYDMLGEVETKIEAGDEHDFVIQLNEQRGKEKRRGVVVTSVRMPFDDEGFNFTKVKLEVSHRRITNTT
jgi:hypothetical protein